MAWYFYTRQQDKYGKEMYKPMMKLIQRELQSQIAKSIASRD